MIAGHDVLAPDAELFVQKCQEAGVSGKWLVWANQPHAFPLGTWAGFPEAKEALAWTIDVLTEA